MTDIPASLADLDSPAGGSADMPEIQTGTGPETIRAVVDALNSRLLPETYVTDGRVVHVEEVSGTSAADSGDEDSPLSVSPHQVDSAELAAMLAKHTFTYKTMEVGKGKDRKSVKEEVTPPSPLLKAALATRHWPRLKPLRGIAGAPLLRPDGTLLQDPGYDDATGLYLASKVPLDRVPDHPSEDQVEDARTFLLDKFLHDFPWEADADRANYLGILFTPILRRYIRALIPFTVFTATMPSSGKTILTSGPGMLYGQRVLTWTDDDAELKKAITSVLADPVGAIIFDNLAEGTVIKSPVLARLITDRTWADRLLGGNVIASYSNDRLWCATGNNLRLGGDMASRTVLIRLDPDMPKPQERTGFAIPNLDHWILSAANQRKVLWNLLVLVIDWTSKDAPREQGITMRQFTPWAEAVGGLLAHHEIKDFLGNIDSAVGIDDEEAQWTSFLAKWSDLFGGRWVTTNEVWLSADNPQHGADQWDGLFISGDQGRRLTNPIVLGKRLTGQQGRHRGPYVLRGQFDRHDKIRLWQVEKKAA